ncbi:MULTISPECIES: IclR family transcriptional regulator [Haloferax]|nr:MULTISPECIES: IclR family transcriptional regulator [Haloferax]
MATLIYKKDISYYEMGSNQPTDKDDGGSPGGEGRPEGVLVSSVAKSIDIIESLRELREPTVSEVATHLGYSVSSVYKHLATLEDRGYVVKDDHLYRPSLRFFEIGSEINRQWLDVYEPARTALEELAQETGENCWLMIEEQGTGVMVCNVSGKDALEPGYFYEGKRAELYRSAAGKAILANLSQDKRNKIIESAEFDKLTEHTIASRETLRDELEQIRADGFAVNDEEAQPNIRALGAPIMDVDNRVLGAISISGPTSRISGEYYETELPEILAEKTNIIEIKLL